MGHVSSDAFDSLIVAVDTDEGVTGWGEMAVISALYGESFAAGALAGIAELAPVLLGADPTQPRRVLSQLDEAMRGQPYVKSALDMACWDVTARAAKRPLCEVLGARHGDAVRTAASRPATPGASFEPRAISSTSSSSRAAPTRSAPRCDATVTGRSCSTSRS
jgi:L-alanine-DL-glutamate epimerase-like enolase superfamily enzyme